MKSYSKLKPRLSKKLLRVFKISSSNEMSEDTPKESSSKNTEGEELKSQIENLKAVVKALQEDLDRKDLNLAKLVRDKEKITSDLLKQKRINRSLLKQLEDERKYYFREKETYCQEMNEYKKLKSSLSCSNISEDRRSIEDYRLEAAKLKKTLSQTLTTNYNLSIKFLRMKNTKALLKSQLKEEERQHKKSVNDLSEKLRQITKDMVDVLKLKVDSVVTPSSKKYIEIATHNNTLVYENLSLQLEIEKLKLTIGKLKLYKTKSETNSRLCYLRNEYCPRKKSSPNQESNYHKEYTNIRPQSSHGGKEIRKPPSTTSQHVEATKIFETLETPGASLSYSPGDPSFRPSKESRKKSKHKQKSKKVKSRNPEKTSMDSKSYASLPKSKSKVSFCQVSDLHSQTSSEFSTYTTPVVTTVEDAPKYSVSDSAIRRKSLEKQCEIFEEINLIKD